jgi:hypothetical protein
VVCLVRCFQTVLGPTLSKAARSESQSADSRRLLCMLPQPIAQTHYCYACQPLTTEHYSLLPCISPLPTAHSYLLLCMSPLPTAHSYLLLCMSPSTHSTHLPTLRPMYNFTEEVYDGRSQWPRGLRRGSAAARLLGSWVRIPPVAWMSVSCECCVLSDRGLCDGLVPRLEESY